MRNYLILFFWICTSWTDVRAQKKDDDGSYIGFLKTILQDGTYAPMIAYNYNSSCGSIELGIAKGWRCSVNDKGTCSGEIGAPMPYHYLSVSSEFMMNNEKLVVCPKISHHITFIMFDVGLSVLTYTDFKNVSVGVKPEIGLTFVGVASLTYGYNIPKISESLGINRNNISFRVIFGTFTKPKKFKHLFRFDNL